jgi:putative DNA primase/helicase
MARPDAIPPRWEGVPTALRDLPQWIVWKHHFHKARQNWIKLPFNPATEKPASVSDPSTWGAFEDAEMAYMMGEYDGVGLVFLAGGGLVGIDIDDCLDADGTLSELAGEIVETVPGYVERSPSGKGLHIITRADIGRAYKDDTLGLEIYTSGRYFTITGAGL